MLQAAHAAKAVAAFENPSALGYHNGRESALKNLLIGQLSQGALNALRVQALDNKRSLEQEARALLEDILCPKGRLHVGSTLAALSQAHGLRNEDVEALEAVRDANPSPPMWFG